MASNYDLALSAAARMSEPTAHGERHQLTDAIDYWVGKWVGDRLVWPAQIADVAGRPDRSDELARDAADDAAQAAAGAAAQDAQLAASHDLDAPARR